MTDVQNCVDANLEAFNQGKSDIADETDDRAGFKARAYLMRGQAIARRYKLTTVALTIVALNPLYLP